MTDTNRTTTTQTGTATTTLAFVCVQNAVSPVARRALAAGSEVVA